MAAGDPVLDLYERVGRGLYAYARSLTGRADLAEDFVQEAFLRYLQTGRSPLDPAAGPFLYGIVRNLGHDLARRSARRAKHESEAARAKPVVSPGSEALALAELEQLPLEQREVVVLKILADLTFEEIGELVRAPAATAASRYRYALEKLTARLSAPQEAR
jgi:RNA polymerase sigma-70 factor (ECF subfamily)